VCNYRTSRGDLVVPARDSLSREISTMYRFTVIAAVLVASSVLPAAAYADSQPAIPATALAHHWRATSRAHMRHVMGYRRYRWQAAAVAPAPEIPVYFAWTIPSTANPGYDRAMVLLLRSPAVSGIYTDDPGYPTTPVVAGGAPYQRQMCCSLFEYDSMTGEYIQLSEADAARMPPPPPNGGVPIPLPTP
jgi:hypothetical protein